MKPGADVRLAVSLEEDLIAVCIDGNLDYTTAPLVKDGLDQAMASRATLVEVRLGAINVVDSSGLSVLIYAYKLARSCGKELVLRGEGGTVARLLRRTSLDRVIPLRPPRQQAAGTLPDSTESADGAASA